MGENVKPVIERVRNAAKEYVEKRFSQEVTFFDVMWEEFASSFREMMVDPRSVNLDLEAAVYEAKRLGFARPEAMDLKLPRIIGTITATLFHLIALKNHPTNSEVADMLLEYSRHFDLTPTTARELEKTFTNVFAAELSSLRLKRETKQWAGYEILVVDSKNNGIPVLFANEADAYSKIERKDYEVFVNDVEPLVYIKGTRMNLKPQPRKLLIYLVIHSGKFFTVDDIIEDVWGPDSVVSEPHRQALKRLRDATGNKMEGLTRFERGSGRYYVKSNLCYCVIARVGSYRFLDRIMDAS